MELFGLKRGWMSVLESVLEGESSTGWLDSLKSSNS